MIAKSKGSWVPARALGGTVFLILLLPAPGFLTITACSRDVCVTSARSRETSVGLLRANYPMLLSAADKTHPDITLAGLCDYQARFKLGRQLDSESK